MPRSALNNITRGSQNAFHQGSQNAFHQGSQNAFHQGSQKAFQSGSEKATNAGSSWIDWDLMKNSTSGVWHQFIIVVPWLIIIMIIIYIIYYLWNHYYDVRRTYNCYSLKNFLNGDVTNCLDEQPDYCKDIKPNLYWGWCLDNDYYGAYPGDRNGPYGINCKQWIHKPKHCPPMKCAGTFPIGIKIDAKNNEIQEYGWCADANINRALKGTYCGPSPEEGIKCKSWIWEESKCPQSCPNNLNVPIPSLPPISPQQPPKPPQPERPPNIKQKPQMKKGKCSLVCGLKNGPCPPPDCDSNNEQCQCKVVKKKKKKSFMDIF